MTPREAARRLGGDVAGPRTVLCPGPGHSPRDRSLSVTFDTRDEFVVFSHAGDDWQACRDHVRAQFGLGRWEPGRERSAPQPRPAPPTDGDMGAWALRLWGETADARGTLAERYLAGRGLELDDRAREALRFYPSCPFGRGRRLPCMVALYRDLRSDKPVAIQRTALTPDAEKIDRMMAGPVAGAACKLDPDDEVTLGLVVAEGIETAMAARMLGYRPTWALGSAGAIASLPVLGGIEALTILGEADDGGANARATEACAKRWLGEGAEVSLLEPIGGGDANDVLRRIA